MRCHLVARAAAAAGVAIVVLCQSPARASAQTTVLPPSPEATFSVGTLVGYSEGDYGTRHTTQILYVPMIFQWFATDRLEFRLTIPYVWEHGRNILAAIGGGATHSLHRVTTRDGVGNGSRRRTEDGLGDILLEGDYVLLEERTFWPEIGISAEIKFPTADARRGLGTGEFDETIGLSFQKAFANQWIASLAVSYTFVGKPSRTSVSDAVGWSLGVSYRPRPGLALSTYFEGATSVDRQEDDPRQLRVQVEYAITPATKVVGSVIKGLTDGAPTVGVAAGIVFEF